MSEFKTKSEQNFSAAGVLRKREYRCFASSIHCMYYSCLQYMTYIIYSKNLIAQPLRQEQRLRGKGSHEIIHNTFEIAYIKEAEDKDYNNYKEWFGQLTQVRIESDYLENEIGELESNGAYDLTKRLLQQLKSYQK
jgi:hypothetical protein